MKGELDFNMKINLIKSIRDEIREIIDSNMETAQKEQQISEVIERLLEIISMIMRDNKDRAQLKFFASAIGLEQLVHAKSMDELVQKFLNS